MRELIAILVTLVSLPVMGAPELVIRDDFSIPEPSDQGRKISLWATHYNIHQVVETEFGLPLLDVTGTPLTANIPPRDWCLGAIEGTISVRSERGLTTLNFAKAMGTSQIDCAEVLKIDSPTRKWVKSVGKSRFRMANGKYGDGVRNYSLVPYRTIAVDPKYIEYGTVLYIPTARGTSIILANGDKLVHDGYFFAADTGGAIRKNHIDVFCGELSGNCFPQFILSRDSGIFDATIVEDDQIVSMLRSLHAPT